MPQIPNEIGEVHMEFAPAVRNDVTQDLLNALIASIKATAVPGETIETLFISSANDQHQCPSRHATGNAVDISRINGKKISVHYGADASIQAIVDGLQMAFENAPGRRENFGPSIQKKEGVDHAVPGHKDHFHWSVNGDHSACIESIFHKMLRLFLPEPRRASIEEVCDV